MNYGYVQVYVSPLSLYFMQLILADRSFQIMDGMVLNFRFVVWKRSRISPPFYDLMDIVLKR